jgi:hypothetical protein
MDVRLVDRDWKRELAQLAVAYSGGLRIICPFVKQNALRQVVGDEIPDDTRVVTRFSLQDFSAGVSDIGALSDVINAGGEVRGIQGLHAKVFIFGDGAAAVTSANLTNQGLHRNAEFGCVSSAPDFVAVCRAYFETLWSQAGSSVTVHKLAEWDEAVRAFLLTAATQGRRADLPDYGAITSSGRGAEPIVVSESVADAAPAWLGEAMGGYVKFFGQGHERAAWDYPVIDEVSASGSHRECTYPKGRRPRQVGDGDAMYLAAMVEHPDDYLIYGRAAAMAYVDGRDDATQADITVRPWRDRWPHYIRVHDAEFVAGTVANGVRLSELMDELKHQAFASTQQNADAGLGENTNPRMALRQQPAVRLSAAGLAWLNERFDSALRAHGRLPADELADLDWPVTSWPTFNRVLAASGVGALQLWTRVRQEAVDLPGIVADIRALAKHIGLADPDDLDFRRSVGHFSQGQGSSRPDRPLQAFRSALVPHNDPHAHSGDNRHPVLPPT